MPLRMGKAQEVIAVSSYQKLDQFLRAFAGGHLNLLILIGNPGLGW